jgi:hypothetical protein
MFFRFPDLMPCTTVADTEARFAKARTDISCSAICFARNSDTSRAADSFSKAARNTGFFISRSKVLSPLFFLMPFLLPGYPFHALYPKVFCPFDLLRWRLISLLLIGAHNIDSFSLRKEAEAIAIGYGNTLLWTVIGTALTVAVMYSGVYALTEGDVPLRTSITALILFTWRVAHSHTRGAKTCLLTTSKAGLATDGDASSPHTRSCMARRTEQAAAFRPITPAGWTSRIVSCPAHRGVGRPTCQPRLHWADCREHSSTCSRGRSPPGRARSWE